MAILKMKRLRLMLVRSRKEELLRELAKLGCVEFAELEGELQESGLGDQVRRESSALMALRGQQASLEHAVGLLAQYAPEKSGLLSAKPELSDETLLDSTGIETALDKAREVAALDERIRRIGAEELRLQGSIESLQPWRSLDLPLEQDGTERTAVLMGTVSSRIPLGQVQAAVEAASDEAEVFPISEDKNARYLLILAMREAVPAVQESLRGFGFTAAALSGLRGTPETCIREAEESLQQLAAEKQQTREQLVDKQIWRDDLKLAADQVCTQVALAEAEERLYGTDSVVVLEGWCPAEREAELATLFDRYDCAWETRDPTEEEYPEVPVKLKNNALTNAMNMVTNMYSLPAYNGVDPNPLMAPFFILFYGLMMADMGYGLIMIAAALVAMKKIKPREGTLSFCQILLYCGISTFIMGALTGGLFGDLPYQLVHMFNPSSTWKGLPYLFNPLAEGGAEPVLYGAMVLGVIQLNTGMVINFIKKKRRGELASAIFEEGSLWIILLGGILYALPALGIVNIPTKIGLVVLIVGALCLLFGAGREAKGFGKVTAAIGCIYNTLTGWFGDILSYSRIMALMLAGSVVGQVFNSIAAMPSAGGVTVFSFLIFLLIFLIGHTLNFALNLLGCFVHDLRLQCLEYFGKFYEDGGRPFDPLRLRTKYAQTKES